MFKRVPSGGIPVTAPEGWRPLMYIDLMHNRQQAIAVNVLSLLLLAAMIAVGVIKSGFSGEITLDYAFALNAFCGAAGMVAYIFAHEAVHGVFMKLISGKTPYFGVSLLYAYAGSDAMFGKRAYLTIAFAPVILLGAALLALEMLLPQSAFWPVFAVQTLNVSGAAGDIYVGLKILRVPADIGIIDRGTDMTVFCRETE